MAHECESGVEDDFLEDVYVTDVGLTWLASRWEVLDELEEELIRGSSSSELLSIRRKQHTVAPIWVARRSPPIAERRNCCPPAEAARLREFGGLAKLLEALRAYDVRIVETLRGGARLRRSEPPLAIRPNVFPGPRSPGVGEERLTALCLLALGAADRRLEQSAHQLGFAGPGE